MRTPFFFLFVLILFGCQNTNSTETATNLSASLSTKIFANYYIRYLEAEEFIKAEAWFKEGDSLKIAEPKILEHGISFMGIEMGHKTVKNSQIKYNFENIGDYPPIFKFEGEESGNPFKMEIAVSPIKEFEVKKCSLSGGLQLQFSESPLADDQRLIVFLKDKEDYSTSFEIEGPLENGLIDLQFNQSSKKLQSGAGQLLLIKKEKKVFEEDNFVNETVLEYYAKGRMVSIME